MKKLQFLLLDAGPIIKLFELGIGVWEKFIDVCDVTIARTVIDEAVYAGQCDSLCYIDFPFEQSADQGRIKIIDMKREDVGDFLKNSGISTKYRIDPGQAETLAFIAKSSDDFLLCTADGPVFCALGFLNRGEQGVSLEELTKKIGLQVRIEWAKIGPKDFNWWKFTKKFREKYTRIGQIDAAQGQGHV